MTYPARAEGLGKYGKGWKSSDVLRPSKLQHYKDRQEYWEKFWIIVETCCHSDSSKRSSADSPEVIIIIPSKRLNRSIWSIHGTLPDQSRSGSNINEGMIHTPQTPKLDPHHKNLKESSAYWLSETSRQVNLPRKQRHINWKWHQYSTSKSIDSYQ